MSSIPEQNRVLRRHHTRIAVAVTLVLFAVFVPLAIQAQSGIDSVVITGVDGEAFPQIRVEFRALDNSNNIVPNLTSSDVAVYENGEPVGEVAIDTADRAPIAVIFVIDQGQYFDYQRVGATVIKESITYLADARYFRDEYDTVAVLTRAVANGEDVTRTLLAPTQSARDFVNEVNALSFDNTGRTDGLGGVESGLAEMAQVLPPGTASTAVIYVGSIIDDVQGQSSAAGDARTVAALAKEQKVKLHVLHTQASGEFAEPFLNLTRDSGGIYARLFRDQDNTRNLDAIYQDLVDQAQTYELTYSSPSAASGARSVVIVPAGVALDAATDAGASYSVEVETPQVTLSLANTEIDRRPQQDPGGDTWSYQVDTVNIEVTVAWRSNPPRDIVAADLVVDGTTQLTVQPDVANNRFQLTWDLTAIEDVTVTLPVQVRVRDLLGVEAVSPSLQVTVNATLPEVVVRETAAPQPTPAPTVEPCVANPGGADCINRQAQRIAPWTTIGLAFVVLVLVVALFLNRKKVGAAATGASDVVRHQVSEVQKTLVGGSLRRGRHVLARLEIQVARRELVGEEVEIYANTTKLGRNPRLCDVQLVNEDDLSTVSGLHCTIQYEPSRNLFLITDDNSSNGTSVNGNELLANEPYILNDGDEIVLGELARRGAKVVFRVAAGQGTITDLERHELTGATGNETIIDDALPQDAPGLTRRDTDMMGLSPPAVEPDEVDDSWLDDL